MIPRESYMLLDTQNTKNRPQSINLTRVRAPSMCALFYIEDGHESARVLEAGMCAQRGPNEFKHRQIHRGVEPRCMAAARGKAPAVVES